MKNQPYVIIQPKVTKVPFVLSIPHCGVDFPAELINRYNQDLIVQPDDTDWFLQQLYDFSTELGITIIYAKYSRWVIDLNRDPESKPLYDDGRIITALTPVTDFFGNKIYANQANEPDEAEVQRRLETYYWPYYAKIQELIQELQQEFKHVQFWDAHSIRSVVPTIRKEKFPEMILGNNDQQTADLNLIATVWNQLNQSQYQVNHNDPFKGGHLTRYFGNPTTNVHALQLEMIKSLYMKSDELTYDFTKADEVKKILKSTFEALIRALEKLNESR